MIKPESRRAQFRKAKVTFIELMVNSIPCSMKEKTENYERKIERMEWFAFSLNFNERKPRVENVKE